MSAACITAIGTNTVTICLPFTAVGLCVMLDIFVHVGGSLDIGTA